MKRTLSLITLLSAAAFLSACAKSDHDVIVEACIAEDGSKAYCDCLTAGMKNNLSPEVFSKIASKIRDDGKSQTEAENALSISEKAQLLKLFPVTMACVSAE